ncbi:unnamed protein product [Caenorhabditis sp. 36 PRJEB53466]|nr:unnamed protein product [Caenorhabditis sp. 36 PRJEB53466]
MSSVTVPRCTPFQREEWAAYGPTVEQQVAGEGRRLQPTLRYSLEKLDMVQKYKVQLKVEQVGEYKMVKVEHCYLEQSDLQAAQIVEHPDGWKTGMEWLGETCDFSALFITNKPNCTKKLHVFVNALRKYIVSVVIISENGTSYTFQFESQSFVVVSNYSQQFKAKKAELKAAKREENPSRAQKKPEHVQVQQEQQAPSEMSSNAPFQMYPYEQNHPVEDNVEWVQIEEDQVVPEDQVIYEYPVEQQEHWEVVPQEVGDHFPLQQYPSENNGPHGQQVLVQEQIEDEQFFREFFYSPEHQQWNNQVENVENVVPHQNYQGGNYGMQPAAAVPGANRQLTQAGNE